MSVSLSLRTPIIVSFFTGSASVQKTDVVTFRDKDRQPSIDPLLSIICGYCWVAKNFQSELKRLFSLPNKDNVKKGNKSGIIPPFGQNCLIECLISGNHYIMHLTNVSKLIWSHYEISTLGNIIF